MMSQKRNVFVTKKIYRFPYVSEYFAFIYIYIYAWCPRRLEKMVAESCKTRVTERRELRVLVTESGPLARAPSALNY